MSKMLDIKRLVPEDSRKDFYTQKPEPTARVLCVKRPREAATSGAMARLLKESNMTKVTRHVDGMSTDDIRGSRQRERAQALRALIGDRSVVYALQLDDGIIKIGCTTNLQHRRNRFGDAEILGFRFGDFDDEAEVHARLRSHVARGREYYHPTQPVLDVVNEMREPFNLPSLVA